MKRIGVGSLVMAGILALGGCVDRDAQAQAALTKEIVTDTTVPVQTVAVRSEDVAVSMELTGSIVADDDIVISAKTPGRLVAVYVREGDEVSAGQVVARQETNTASVQLRQAQAQVSAARSQLAQAQTDARVGPEKTAAAIRASEARVRQAKAALDKALNGARSEEKAQAKANLDRAKSDLDTAKKARDRSQRLFDQGAIAQAELEAAVNRYESAMAGYTSALESYNLALDSVRPEDIESAREQVRQAEEQLRVDQANKRLDLLLDQRVEQARANLNAALESERLARINIEDLTITAPANGKISGRPLKAGTYVNPGASIARLVGVQGAYYEAEVPEKDIARLTVGMPVEVTIQALNGLVMTGFVASVDPLASDLGRLYKVRVSLTEAIGQVRPGMFAKGSVLLSMEADSTVVPNEAIIRDGETAYVFIVEGSKAVRRDIQIIRTSNGNTVVEGVEPGDDVITTGKTQVVDGTTVRTGDSEPSADAAGQEG